METSAVESSEYKSTSAFSFEPCPPDATIEAAASRVSTSRFGPPIPSSSPATNAVATWTRPSRSRTFCERKPAPRGLTTGPRRRTRNARNKSVTSRASSSTAVSVGYLGSLLGTTAKPTETAIAQCVRDQVEDSSGHWTPGREARFLRDVHPSLTDPANAIASRTPTTTRSSLSSDRQAPTTPVSVVGNERHLRG